MSTAHIPLTFCPYQSSYLISPLYITQCPYKADKYVLASRSTLVCSCVGVYKRMSFKNSSLLYQQCQACLARLSGMVCEMGGCTTTVLFNAKAILVEEQ